MGRRAPASTRPEAQLPAAPAWHLDSVGVAAEARGRGIRKPLAEHRLRRAHAAGHAAVLETATPRKVAFYERLGFRVVLDADAPGGGPHVWFLRCDP
ncbi:MAG TPA: GNAT family N-acetyltransferase [Gaiellaceae bacterium]|nr:GNAT family N-acetyltransferase [Gaiellaceae bacterium]